MKSDIELQRNVTEELAWLPSVNHLDIEVTVGKGMVTLNGYVDNYAQKLAAEHSALGVFGVQAVADELKVRIPDHFKAGDQELAEQIINVFAWNVSIPHDRITVKVDHNWVTLGGQVEWYYQREAAYTAAGQVTGVTGITDRIVVHNLASPLDVRERIVAAFKRSSTVDSDSIKVVADAGIVTLTGTVATAHESSVAEQAAWSAPGVQFVHNNLVTEQVTPRSWRTIFGLDPAATDSRARTGERDSVETF